MKYVFEHNIINNKKIISHTLRLKRPRISLRKNKQHTIINLVDRFIRQCPNKEIYKKRLHYELKLIEDKNLCNYLIRAIDILELTNYIPHVTRGSCGSSLVCYLLGISNVDPIKYNISFARFLNEYRDSLPDIDFDFPHYLRDEVFLKLELRWPNQVARISNHVHWHEKSALREALRMIGIKKRIGANEIRRFVDKLPKEKGFGKKAPKKIREYFSSLFTSLWRYYILSRGYTERFNIK